MEKLRLKKSCEPREYQQKIFASSMNKNTFVVLPTGLGKTLIGVMLSVFNFNKDPSKKILFLAPTKPLVEQQKNVFEELIENSDILKIVSLNGLIPPKKRKEIYKEVNFIFSTPQLIENDIINKIINIKDISFCIFDEGHRATKNYAYCFVADALCENCKFLALSASPATSKQEILQVLENLKCENLEVRESQDLDVSKYIKKTNINYVEVELPKEILEISNLLNKAFEKIFQDLKNLNFFFGKTTKQISRQNILDFQNELRVKLNFEKNNSNIWSGISLSSAIMKLLFGIELVESQEISSAHNYFENIFRFAGDSSKAAEILRFNLSIRSAFEKLSNLKKENFLHPKIPNLKKILEEKMSKNENSKFIVFSQYRDTTKKIFEVLKDYKNFKPAYFIGQAKKGEIKMSQKEQKKTIEDFRLGVINILISTSVGEEGLDIPKVDFVIFYEPVPSAIRTIQRIGRTGRFEIGEANILISKNSRDVVIRHIAKSKENRMYKAIYEIKKDFGNRKNNLNFFVEEKSLKQNLSGENSEKNFSSKPLIYVDSRENNDLLKKLFKSSEIEIETKKLEVGDLVLSEYTAIERKSKKDFINSILDKKIFRQLLDLARNYKRSVLILEGEESLYSIRNVKPNVIFGALCAISIDLKIPIIETKNIEETTQLITYFAKRLSNKNNKNSLFAYKKSKNENEELEKLVSSIPTINILIAKKLLKEFKTIQNMANAHEKDFEKVEGIGKIRTKNLENFFRREWRE